MNIAVITTHNEAETIRRVVDRVHRYCYWTIVIDEQSTDGTYAELVGSNGVVAMDGHGGIGSCLMQGWQHALKIGADRIIQLDAGLSHDPTQIPALLASSADLVIGSRFVPGGSHGGPWWRVVGSQTYGYVWRQHTRTDIRDWTSGYRVFTADLLRELIAQPYRARMHAWNAEVLHHAITLGAKIEEVPIHYYPSDSSLDWRGVVEALRILR